MKISRLESLVLLLTSFVLVFMSGWYLSSNSDPRPFLVETRHQISEAEDEALPLPLPSVIPTTINLNTATAEQLMSLPGIGEKRAEAILLYRTTNGSFSKVEDITLVSGIGEATYQGMKGRITVEDTP